MDSILQKTLLYDFYGDLLTDHQKKIYEAVLFEDHSLSEVAEEEGITRQGVYDLKKRCDSILAEYEKKLGLLNRYILTKKNADAIIELTDPKLLISDEERLFKIKTLAERIKEDQ